MPVYFNNCLGLIWLIGLLAGCHPPDRPGIENGFTLSSNQSAASLNEGRQLARQYCQSCHAFPEPALLNKESWERYVLPTMGYRLGWYHADANKASRLRRDLIENGKAGELVLAANIFPVKPVLPADDFQKIVDYYLTAAPAQPLGSGPRPIITPDLTIFQIKAVNLPYRPASTTVVKINPATKSFYLGMAQPPQIINFNSAGQVLGAWPLPHVPATIFFRPAGIYALNMGSFFPSDAPAGNLLFFPNQAPQTPLLQLKGLQRPVQAQLTDLNNDKKADWLICEFGNLTGSLSWFGALPHHQYQKHTLKNSAGAVQAYVQVFNHDQRPDVMALMAQGDEGIFVFYNLGQGKFREEQILQFSPAQGSSYFELADFNQDGHADILYTAGDNADFSPIKKKYHGIRIYLNNGQNQFKEAYFFPQHGTYKATAADFDGDGDLDVAAIAYFARFKENPAESFVYLQNLGNLQFKAQTLKNNLPGRWLTLDQGDLDGDGDPDLVLGSFPLKTQLATQAQHQAWVTDGPAAVMLINQTR